MSETKAQAPQLAQVVRRPPQGPDADRARLAEALRRQMRRRGNR